MTSYRLPPACRAAARLLSALALTVAVTLPAAAGSACHLIPIAIQPAGAEPTETYGGQTTQLRIRFHNDKTSGPVEVFPEPPVTVSLQDSGSSCQIQDGGIWVRQHVFASDDGGTLVLHEYSGSHDELAFYDTRSCRKSASLDVSNATWQVDGTQVQLRLNGTRSPTLKVALDGRCLPSRSAGSRVRR